MDTDKKTRILNAAIALFAKHGFKKTSIDEVATGAAVGKGTVYLVAKSKADLFYQAVHQELRAWIADVAGQLDPREPADKLLVECTLASTRYLESRPLVRDLLLGNYDEMAPLWVGHLNDLRQLGIENMVQILELGIRQEIFRSDLDTRAVATILQELHAAGMVASYREGRTVSEELIIAKTALDLLLKGMLVR